MSASVVVVEQLPDASDSPRDAHSVAGGFSPSVPSRRVRADSLARALVREALRGRVAPSSDTPSPVVLDARGVRALPALSSGASLAVVGREARAADDERTARALVVESATLAATVPSGEVVDALREGAALGFIPSTTADSAAARLSSWAAAHLAALNAKRDAEARRYAARHDAGVVAPVVLSIPSPPSRRDLSADDRRRVRLLDTRVTYEDASIAGGLRWLAAAGKISTGRYHAFFRVVERDGRLPDDIRAMLSSLCRNRKARASKFSQAALAARRDARERVPVSREGLRYSVVLRVLPSRDAARVRSLSLLMPVEVRPAVTMALDGARHSEAARQFAVLLEATLPRLSVPVRGRATTD